MATQRPATYIDDSTSASTLYWGSGSWIAVRLPEEKARGQVGVTHFSCSEGESVPLHKHTREDELFLVARGRVRLTADGSVRVVGQGGVAYLPRGSVHRYEVLQDETEFFVATLPGGFERFFAAAGIDPDGRAESELRTLWTRERANRIEEHLGLGLEWFAEPTEQRNQS